MGYSIRLKKRTSASNKWDVFAPRHYETLEQLQNYLNRKLNQVKRGYGDLDIKIVELKEEDER